MVLHLKVWESKSLPGLLASQIINKHDAGWSSPVARQAHNLKVVGSNPTPATNYINKINNLDHPQRLRFLGFFCCFIDQKLVKVINKVINVRQVYFHLLSSKYK